MSQAHPQSIESMHVVKPVGDAIAFKGYAWGVRQPSLQYAVQAEKNTNERGLLELDAILSGLLDPDATALAAERSSDPAVTRLLKWPTALLRAGSHSVFQPARASVQRPGGTLHLIQQPCLQHGAARSAVNFVIGAINLFGSEARSADARASFEARLSQLLKSLKHTGMRGFNPAWFLAAADELRVPWAHLRGDIFLFGWGARGRWLQSSFTDQTSRIGTNLARNKVDSAAVLRTNGAPVPEHVSVHSEAEAVAAAEKMGYPVVVKPIDLDGGKGVRVNIRTAAAVREAYADAFALSKQVLVEKYVNGRDFRIQVVHGEVHGVLERVPGGVMGNGVDGVKTLLERQNLDRKSAADDRRFLHEIAEDKEALGLLAEQGLDWEAVPGDGRFVRLRSASNVASGGVPTPVALDQVHPDNLALAIRATRLLRLDVAGVDLLIPDIARSWLEGGAAICEVNAQPQMFTTMHKPMLASLLGGTDGRIPVAIVIGENAASERTGNALHRELLARGVHAGLAFGKHVRVGRDLVCTTAAGAFAGAKMLCNDPGVEAMVICVSDKAILNQGWPVDRCDVLVLPAGPSARQDTASALEFSAHLAPRRVIVEGPDAALLARAKGMFGASAIVESAPPGTTTTASASVADTMMRIDNGSRT